MEPNSNPEFNKFFKRTTTKAFTEARATPVILVCIYNHNNTLITHDLLFNIFSQYGKVHRILIFEKVKVWKAFVEFSTLESAFDAKRNLNDFMIFSDGTRMNIYFSNLDTIKFQNNNSGGVSYIPEDDNNSPDLQNLQMPLSNFSKPNAQSPNAINDQNPIQNIYPPQIIRKNTPSQNSPTTFDDKGDEIFKIINERQQDKTPPQNDEEEKHDTEDSESNSFNPSLLSVFQQKPSQPVIINNQHFASKPKTIVNRPYEDADAVQRPVIVRHAGHKHTAPPGLAIYQNLGMNQGMNQGGFHPQQNEQRRMIPSPGSFNQIGQISPPKNAQVFRPPSVQEFPRIVNPLPSFENRPNFRVNNTSNYVYNPTEGNPRIQSNNFSPNGPLGGNDMVPTLESGEGSPDGLGHQNLFDLIEQDIAAELSSKMKNLDINAGQGYDPNYQFNNNIYDNGDDKKSQVLYVKGLEDRDMSIQMIYNLFSNFGNVLKVIFIRSKGASLLEYENAEYATIAKDYLNNIVLLKKSLRIFYSNYSIVNLRHKKTASNIEEVLIGNPKTFRFKKNKNISINPPSATLHISNLAQEVAYEEAIHNFFGLYGTILALKFLLIDGTKHQCLMKMSSIEESINIMAILHDGEFGGRRVQLSFTRSKI